MDHYADFVRFKSLYLNLCHLFPSSQSLRYQKYKDEEEVKQGIPNISSCVT